MCCPGGGDAPNPPDPYATADAQKKAFIDSSLATAGLNRYDEDSPFGSSFWQTVDANNRDLGMMNGIQRMRKVTTLNPEEQRILDLSRGNKIALGELAQSKIGEIDNSFGTPFDFSQAPGAGYGVLKRLQALANKGGPKLDEAARQQVQDALYRRETAELDPRFKQEQIDLETQLANQGIARGSEAWRKATNQFSRQKNRTYGDALDRAILAGGAEQSRLFGLKSARRAQNLGALQNLFGLKQAGRNNWLQEQLARRQMPMDELNMLLGQSQGYNVPQFKNPSDINIQAPDIQSLISGDYKNKLDIWGQDQKDSNALAGNIIGGLGSAAGGYAASAAGSAAITKALAALGTAAIW